MEYSIVTFIVVGFLAQIVDGTLGMGYGVLSSSFLLSMALSPGVTSASVHTSEMFTTGISGFFHMRMGNVDPSLFKKLLIPGLLGGIIGAYLLSSIDSMKIRPFIALYMFLMGAVILWRAFKKVKAVDMDDKIIPLGFAGGFCDAIGGGGWGPIVTSTLVAAGSSPRNTIGSVNTAEFFITMAESITFIITIGLSHWKIILGLLTGGVLAAPLGAWLCKKLPARGMSAAVGILIVILSVRTIYVTLF